MIHRSLGSPKTEEHALGVVGEQGTRQLSWTHRDWFYARSSSWVTVSGNRWATPNPSFNPRRATAAGVSPVRATRSIIAHRAYTARLRARG